MQHSISWCSFSLWILHLLFPCVPLAHFQYRPTTHKWLLRTMWQSGYYSVSKLPLPKNLVHCFLIEPWGKILRTKAENNYIVSPNITGMVSNLAANASETSWTGPPQSRLLSALLSCGLLQGQHINFHLQHSTTFLDQSPKVVHIPQAKEKKRKPTKISGQVFHSNNLFPGTNFCFR